MIDPLAQVVTLLQPGAGHSKVASAAGHWRVQRTVSGRPFYCVVLEGECLLQVGANPAMLLGAEDFVLIPAAHDFSMGSPGADPEVEYPHTLVAEGEVRLGDPEKPPDVRILLGYCEFGSPDSALLVSLLPQLIYVHGEKRLATLVQLLRDETRARRHAREMVLERLLEVLFIEALRSTAGIGASPGLLRGLSDHCLAGALRALHQAPAHSWTVTQLARAANLSRSAFFQRFSRAVGVAPMEYLLSWRMALARKLLRHGALSIAEVAERVGYSSASTFTVAFSRLVGMPPARYGRSNETLSATRRPYGGDSGGHGFATGPR